MEEKPLHEKEIDKKHPVNTGGGSYVAGSVNTGGGDYIGRDKNNYGDEVHGNKIIIYPQPLSPEDVRTRTQLRGLLDNVKNYFTKRWLDDPIRYILLLDVEKQWKNDAVDSPLSVIEELPDQANKILPLNTKIIDLFKQSIRSLLILGEPGSGKTTTLLELTRDLINLAESDETFTHPIPVIFLLSSWTKRKQPLMDWMADEIKKYGVAKKDSRLWLKEHRILPLLDGLDELAFPDRFACVEAINRFKEVNELPEFVVCSRLQEYIELPIRLKLQGAIQLLPLTYEQMDDYLRQAGSKLDVQLDVLRSILKESEQFQFIARSPLMLNIMALSYQDMDVKTLTKQSLISPEEHDRYLFEKYVERMLARKSRNLESYPSKDTKHWLSWLAHNLEKSNRTDFSLLKDESQIEVSWIPEDLQNIYQSVLYGTFSWLFGVCIGSLIGLIIFWVTGLTVREVFNEAFFWILKLMAYGLIIVIFSFAIFSLLDRNWMDKQGADLTSRLGILFTCIGLLGPLAATNGLLLMIPLVFAYGIRSGEVYRFVAEMSIGLTVGLAAAVALKRKNLLIIIIIGILAGGLAGGLVGVMLGGRVILLIIMQIGVVIACSFSHEIIIEPIRRFFLWRARYMPWNYLRFLDYATERIFLQKTGTVTYSFVHKRLQEYFASLDCSEHQKSASPIP